MSDQPKPTKLEEIEARWKGAPRMDASIFRTPRPSTKLLGSREQNLYSVEAARDLTVFESKTIRERVDSCETDIAWLVARVEELEKRLDDRFRDEAADMMGIGPPAR